MQNKHKHFSNTWQIEDKTKQKSHKPLLNNNFNHNHHQHGIH